jgi:hypothetical protein
MVLTNLKLKRRGAPGSGFQDSTLGEEMPKGEIIICHKCGCEKHLSDYPFRKDSQTYRKTCRDRRNAARNRALLAPERLEATRETGKLKQRRRRKLKGQLINGQRREAYEENREKIFDRNKTWRRDN